MAHYQHSQNPVEARCSRFTVLLKHLWSNNRGNVVPFALIPITALTSGLGLGFTLINVSDLAHQIGVWFTHLMGEDLLNKTIIWIFDLMTRVLWTPAELFDNDWFRKMVKEFSLISMSFVSVLTMFEGVKRIFNIAHTKFTKIMIRFPIALAVCAFAPTAFVKAVEILNKATRFVVDSGVAVMNQNNTAFHPDNPWVVFDQVAMTLFILLYIFLMIPMFLQVGKRWFDMLSLGILTPFAMLCYIFDSLSKFHKKWWNTLKKLFVIQLVYAIFVTILSAIMFTFPFPVSIGGGFAKALILLGGLYRLAFPPSFVRNMFDKGENGQQAMGKLITQIGKTIIFKKPTS